MSQLSNGMREDQISFKYIEKYYTKTWETTDGEGGDVGMGEGKDGPTR
jgi:hypothetical protein